MTIKITPPAGSRRSALCSASSAGNVTHSWLFFLPFLLAPFLGITHYEMAINSLFTRKILANGVKKIDTTNSVRDTVNLPAVARSQDRSAMRERGVPSSRHLLFMFEVVRSGL